MKTKKIIKTLFFLMIFLILSSFAISLPYLDSKELIDPTASCNAIKNEERIFKAESENINIGIACCDNAKVILYECADSGCANKEYVDTGYKVNSISPIFKGFTIGTYYEYDCYECPRVDVSCPKCKDCSEDLMLWFLIILFLFILGVFLGYYLAPRDEKCKTCAGTYKRKLCPRDKTPMRKTGALRQGPKGGKRPVYRCPKCGYKSM